MVAMKIYGIMVFLVNDKENYESSYLNVNAFSNTYFRTYPRI